MRILTTALLLVVCSMSFGQGVKPNEFTEKTTATATDEIYSQYNDLPRRITFATARNYFLPGAVSIPDASQGAFNPASYPGRFVVDNNRNAWYVDATGTPHRLNVEVVTEMPVDEGTPGYVLQTNGDGTSQWTDPVPDYQEIIGHTGASLTVTPTISGDTKRRLRVTRSGYEMLQGVDYNITGQTLTWSRATTGENIKIWVE